MALIRGCVKKCLTMNSIDLASLFRSRLCRVQQSIHKMTSWRRHRDEYSTQSNIFEIDIWNARYVAHIAVSVFVSTTDSIDWYTKCNHGQNENITLSRINGFNANHTLEAIEQKSAIEHGNVGR